MDSHSGRSNSLPPPSESADAHSHAGHVSLHPQPQPSPQATASTGAAEHYVSYEEMILRALGHAQDHWASSESAKPFPGAAPKQVFAYMARHYAHLLPNSFKGSATQALKKAVKKGLVLHLNRAYAINPNSPGTVAPGRVKPKAWTDKLRLPVDEHLVAGTTKPRCPKAKPKTTTRPTPLVHLDARQNDPSESDLSTSASVRQVTPHSALRLPDPIHFISPSSFSSSALSSSSAVVLDSGLAPVDSSPASSSSHDKDDADLAAQILLTFSSPLPPPPPSTTAAAHPTFCPRPPALSPSSSQTLIPDFGIPTPDIDSTGFVACCPNDIPGSCLRPPTSPSLFPSAPWWNASTWCSRSMDGSELGVMLPPPLLLPIGDADVRSAADIVDSILFPHRPSAVAASAVSEFDATPPHNPPSLPALAPPYPSSTRPQAWQHALQLDSQHASHPIAWLPVRLGPNSQLILPEGWSFIKPAPMPLSGAAFVNVNGVGMVDERASSESSYGSASGAGARMARWWEGGSRGDNRNGSLGRRPAEMGV